MSLKRWHHRCENSMHLIVTQQVYEGRSPVGKVILVSIAPVHRNGIVSSRAVSTLGHVEDIVRLTGEVLEEDDEIKLSNKSVWQTGKGNQSEEGSNGKFLHSWKGLTGVRKQSEDAKSCGLSVSSANPDCKVGIVPTNIGGRSRDTNRTGGKKLMSRKSVPHCSRPANGDKKLPDLSLSQGESVVSGAWKSRLKDPCRIDYSRSAAVINGRLRSESECN